MKSLRVFLQQPFPYNDQWQFRLRVALFFGLFVLLFLLLFRPFGIALAPWSHALKYAAAFGAVCFAGVFLGSMALSLLSPSFFREKGWTIGRQMIFMLAIVVLLAILNNFTLLLLTGGGWNNKQVIWFLGITLAVGLPPIFLFTIIKQMQLLQSFRENALAMEIKLKEKHQWEAKLSNASSAHDIITINGDYENESLTVSVDQLYLLQAASNYIKVYYLQGDKVVYRIIRLTMKRVEELLAPHAVFFRCHRSCIINLDKVKHIDGNAQGYRVTLQGVDEQIPVSRSLGSEFSDKLLMVRSSVS